MRVMILNGSSRPAGNTKQMVKAFCEGLEGMGVFTTNGYDPGVPEKQLDEIRSFGASL